MIKGATYDLVTSKQGKVCGVYLGHSETVPYKMKILSDGEIIEIEGGTLISMDLLSPALPSNHWKAILSGFFSLGSAFSDQQVFYVQIVELPNGLFNLAVFLENKDIDSKVFYCNDCEKREVFMNELEVGATYVFQICCNGVHSEVDSGILVRKKEQLLYFLCAGTMRHILINNLTSAFKVRGPVCLEIPGSYDFPDIPIAAEPFDYWVRTYCLTENDQSYDIHFEYEYMWGVYWNPLNEKMYWGQLDNPFVHELKPGDSFRCPRLESPIFIEKIEGRRLFLVTSSNHFFPDLAIGECISFDEVIARQTAGIPLTAWQYVPREKHPEYTAFGLSSISDWLQRTYLSYIDPKSIIHVEFFETGIFHVYSLVSRKGKDSLQKKTYIKYHNCLTSDGRHFYYKEEEEYRILLVEKFYIIDTTDEYWYSVSFEQEKDGRLIFRGQRTGKIYTISPEKIINIRVCEGSLPSLDSECLLVGAPKEVEQTEKIEEEPLLSGF